MPDDEDPKNGDHSDSFSQDEPSRDLPGLSSIFSTTQSGLKRIRKARGSIDPEHDDPGADEDTPEFPDAGPGRDAAPQTPAPEPDVPDDLEEVEDGPAPPPPTPPAQTAAPEAPGDDIEVSGGLSMVETREMPARGPEAAPPPQPAPAAAEPKPPSPPASGTTASGTTASGTTASGTTASGTTAQPAPGTAEPPTPPPPPPPKPAPGGVQVHQDRSPSSSSTGFGRQTDAELPVVDTTYPDAPKPQGTPNWLIYLGVVAVVVVMVGALILTAMSLK